MATAVWTCLDLRGWQLLSWCWGRQRQEGLDGIALAWLVQAETKRKIQPSVPSMSSTLLCHLIPAKVLKILRDKDQSRGIRSSRCNVDALLPKWGDNRGPVRLVWIAFVLDAWRGHVHRCAQMCRYCKVVAGACIPWNSSYAMCLWWSSKYIWCISMQKFRGKVTFKIFQESVAKIPAWQPDRITKKSTHIHTLWLWIMSIYVIHFGMKSRTIGERRFFLSHAGRLGKYASWESCRDRAGLSADPFLLFQGATSKVLQMAHLSWQMTSISVCIMFIYV